MAGENGNEPDLSRLRPALGAPYVDDSEEGKKFAEQKIGLRCQGCGERITLGFEFVRVTVLRDPATLNRIIRRASAYSCARPECDFALEASVDATAVRRIKDEWLFMDDERMQGMFNDAKNS